MTKKATRTTSTTKKSTTPPTTTTQTKEEDVPLPLTCMYGTPWLDHFQPPTGTGAGCPVCPLSKEERDAYQAAHPGVSNLRPGRGKRPAADAADGAAADAADAADPTVD